jgi:hypothetical protein
VERGLNLYTNKRFYEAAPGRQWMAGLTTEYRF